jgi:hypothetical protein
MASRVLKLKVVEAGLSLHLTQNLDANFRNNDALISGSQHIPHFG